MTTETVYRSDTRPDFAPFEESCGVIRGFTYGGDLATEVTDGRLDRAAALGMLDDMLAIREMEEMIVRLRSGGGYEPLPGYDYRGPTHVSIGQEGAAVGASSVLRVDDKIPSSHRGRGSSRLPCRTARRWSGRHGLPGRRPEVPCGPWRGSPARAASTAPRSWRGWRCSPWRCCRRGRGAWR